MLVLPTSTCLHTFDRAWRRSRHLTFPEGPVPLNILRRIFAASIPLLAFTACDRDQEATATTQPVSTNAAAVQEDRIGPGVLEQIRAGGNPRNVVALNDAPLAAPPVDQISQAGRFAVPPGLARLRADIAAAQRSAIARARREALLDLRQFVNVPAFAANVNSEDVVRALAGDPSVRRIDLDVGGTGLLTKTVRVIAANERHDVGNKGEGVVNL